MAAVGDKVQVPSKRVGQAPRDGVVTGVSGTLLRVTWSSGEESTIFPSMGSLVVVGKVRAPSKKATTTARGTSKKAVKKVAPAPVEKAAPKVVKASSSDRSGKAAAKKAKPATKKTAKGPSKAKGAGTKKSSSKGPGRAGKRRK